MISSLRRAGRQRRLAPRGRADAADDLLRVGVLEQVAERAGVERAEDPVAVGERGEHDHPRRRPGLHDRARGLDAVELGHLEVHEHDVGLGARARARPPRAVGGGPDDLDVLGAARAAASSAVAHERVVVGESSRITRAAPPGGRACPRRATESTLSVAAGLVGEVAHQAQAEVAAGASILVVGREAAAVVRDARARGPFARRRATLDVRRRRAWARALRSASWATR